MSNRWKLKDVELKLSSTGNQATVSQKAKKYSTIPRKNNPDIGANALTKQALKILDLKGFNVWRQNNAGVFDPVKKVFRRNSSNPGVSDILGYHRKTGIILACEIKAGKDRLSAYQETFLEGIRRAGGVAMVIRTVEDLERLYKRDISEIAAASQFKGERASPS